MTHVHYSTESLFEANYMPPKAESEESPSMDDVESNHRLGEEFFRYHYNNTVVNQQTKSKGNDYSVRTITTLLM